jgi:hypothetical protein
MKLIVETKIDGIPRADKLQKRSGIRVVEIKTIAAWTASHARITMLAKRTAPVSDMVHPTMGSFIHSSPGVVNGMARAAKRNGSAIRERRNTKRNSSLDSLYEMIRKRKYRRKPSHSPSGSKPTAKM